MKHARDMLEVATEEPPMVTGFEMTAPAQEVTVRPQDNWGASGASIAYVPKPELQNESPFERVMRLASDPNFDVEKLDRLVAMIREQERDKQRQAFNRAMVTCQKDMQPIARNAKNDDTKSTYATFDKVAEAIVPVYTRHGFTVNYGTDEARLENCVGVTALVTHEDGYERTYRGDFPLDRTGRAGTVNKTGIHAYGSSLSYARRYLAFLIFNLATKGGDKDGNQPGDTITDEQVEKLQKRLVSVGLDIPAFMQRLKIERLEEIPAKEFDPIMRKLDQREKVKQQEDAK